MKSADRGAWRRHQGGLRASPVVTAQPVNVAAGEELVVGLKVGQGGGAGGNSVAWDNMVVVPEPGTVLLGFAGLALILRRRRR